MKPVPCDYCGAPYHAPYEDGLVECRVRLREQLDAAQEETEQRVLAEVVAALRSVEANKVCAARVWQSRGAELSPAATLADWLESMAWRKR